MIQAMTSKNKGIGKRDKMELWEDPRRVNQELSGGNLPLTHWA
jgi:hypothetical protein